MHDHPWLSVLALLAAIGAGLIAGVFFAFSTFVMKALSRLAPAEGIRAMQQINLVVLNPMFLGVFMGTAIVCFVVGVAAGFMLPAATSVWLIAGSACYVVGTFGVTVAGNVPFNEALAKVSPDDSTGHAVWADYRRRWTMWNHVRTIAGVSAMALLIVGVW